MSSASTLPSLEAMQEPMSILRVACTVLAVCLYAAPLRTAREIAFRRSTGAFSVIPFVAMGVSSTLWSLYGLMKWDVMVICVNCFGMASSLYCTWVYMQFSQSSTRTNSVAVVGVTLVVLVLVYLRPDPRPGAIDQAGVTEQLGLVSATFTVLMFASPLSEMRRVVRERSAASIPRLLSVVQTCNCVAWVLYGWALSDVYMWLPNGLGFILAIVQLYLIFKFPAASGIGMRTESGSPLFRPTF